jgi:acetylornithine deacetylase/succinyl-diaminopimelate desuccinylase-like protein
VLAAILVLAPAAPTLAAEGAKAPVAADQVIRAVRNGAGFRAAMANLDRTYGRIVEETVELAEIPAPPFKEKARAEAFMAKLETLGLTEVEMDAAGNVMGLRRGTGPAGGPVVVLAAHLDTVFPEGVDVKVRREGTRLHAPGVGDDTHALAVALAYIRALDAGAITTKKDILFVGDVGEEGPGDLRGMRHLFGKGRYRDRIAAFLSMDGSDASRVIHGAVGSHRYRVTFRGPGGHSYGAFGLVNPMAALGTTIVEMNRIRTPAEPRTTYMTSVVGGGVSVNSIPDNVWLEVDMRSESPAELARLDAKFHAIVTAAVDAENAARATYRGRITADVESIGQRPAGATPADAPIVRLTAAAVRAAGYAPRLGASSTDSNIPISLGVPAVTIGSGGTGGRAHSLDEWIDVSKPESLKGMGVGLAALLAMAGD